jgi:hypothetical protein
MHQTDFHLTELTYQVDHEVMLLISHLSIPSVCSNYDILINNDHMTQRVITITTATTKMKQEVRISTSPNVGASKPNQSSKFNNKNTALPKAGRQQSQTLDYTQIR